MTKHASFIRLDAARSAYAFAEANCTPWSFEGFDANEPHECCYDLDDAQRELSLARKAHRKETQS